MQAGDSKLPVTISKEILKLLVIWIIIVSLGAINATVYALNDREQQTYNQKIASLEKEIETKRIALIRQERESAPQHAKATEATAEEKGIINALNNGQAVTDVTSSTKQDCSQFEKNGGNLRILIHAPFISNKLSAT